MSTDVSVLTALIEARRLIDEGWTQQTFARDGNGNMCFWAFDQAESFCSIGAIYRAIDFGKTLNSFLCIDVIIGAVAKHMPLGYETELGENLTRFNDAKGRRKEEILAAFDGAIAEQMKLEPSMVVQSEELELA
jgi:hypothetical protein